MSNRCGACGDVYKNYAGLVLHKANCIPNLKLEIAELKRLSVNALLEEIAELKRLSVNALLEATNTVIKQQSSIQELAESLNEAADKIEYHTDRHIAKKYKALANKHLKK